MMTVIVNVIVMISQPCDGFYNLIVSNLTINT